MKYGTSFYIAVAMLAGCANPVHDLAGSALDSTQQQASSVQAYIVSGGTEGDAIKKGVEIVKASLKDPDSANFRNVVLNEYGKGKIICGEVNSKNSYGGYVGFKRFTAGTNSSTLESWGSQYADIDHAANAGIYNACPK